MKKALTTAISWWPLFRPKLQPPLTRPCHQSLPMTSIILEKYLNFTHGIHTHSEPSIQERESTETVLERTSDSKPPSDSQNAVLTANASNDDVKANVISNLKVSKRHDLAMVFTCKVCETRLTKTCSRESYEKGVVVVRCDGCNNLHLIADQLGWFGEPGSIEDLLAARGDSVKKGSVDSLNLTLEDLAGKKL